MEFFTEVGEFRLRSVHGMYLARSDDDGTNVSLCRDPSNQSTLWKVEVSQNGERIHLTSSDGHYLTPRIEEKALLGLTGRKVGVQPRHALVQYPEWTPTREGEMVVQLRDASRRYLRANAGILPWRNSVTLSKMPRLPFMRNWLLWHVEVRPTASTDTVSSGNDSFESATESFL